MKIAVSLTETTARVMEHVKADNDAGTSTVVEAALKLLFSITGAERAKRIKETMVVKRAFTRTGWQRAFLTIIAEEFGLADPEAAHPHGGALTPRIYGGFILYPLLVSLQDPEFGDVVIDVIENRTDSDIPRRSKQFHFDQSDSVYDKAREVADWIKNNQKP